jgi:hypothetical protein
MRSSILFVPLLLVATGCPKSNGTAPEAGASDATTATDAATASGDGGGEEVEPVYPVEANAKPLPLAEKLCDALTAMPEKKRSECCKSSPGVVITAECTRMLSSAMRHGAVELAEADANKCIDAFTKTLEGCDWVGPFPPSPPAACQGILKGKIAQSQRCRSSLECAGDLRCAGVGPTATGRCVEGKPDGETCGGIVDTLAGYTRQIDLEKQHSECKNKCIKRRCAPPATDGKPCQTTADCVAGLQCVAAPGPAPKIGMPTKTCTAGKVGTKAGDACPGGECEGDLQCIKGKCAARKAGGEDCTVDFECRGGCLKPDGGDKGKCGPRCDIR